MWFFKKDIEKAPLRPFVAVRMEAIGGQGANSAGKILAEAAVLGMKYTGNHFSSFGSEKRGTPVRSFVRFAQDLRKIRSASFISKPDLLMIFHENLIGTHHEVLDGVDVDTDLLINSSLAPDKIPVSVAKEAHSISTVPATKIALQIGCGLNVIMLGAAVGLYQELEEDKVLAAIENFFHRLSAEQKKKNRLGFEAGKKQVRMASYRHTDSEQNTNNKTLPPLGWQNAPFGGIITNPGNMILKDHSVSRKGVAPKLLKEVCYHCGYCDAVCPDFCFIWEKNSAGEARLLGIDYQYCKGCQKCITACPASALVLVDENELTKEDKTYEHAIAKIYNR